MYRLEMNAKKFIRTRVYLLRYRVVQLDLTPDIEVSYLLMLVCDRKGIFAETPKP